MAFPSCFFFPAGAFRRLGPALPGLCREGPAAGCCLASPRRGGSRARRRFAVACLGMEGETGEGRVSPASLPGATGSPVPAEVPSRAAAVQHPVKSH